MKEEEVKELFNLFFELMPLYHKNIGTIIRKEDEIEPKCHKNQIRAMLIMEKKRKITPTQLGISLDLRKGSLTTLIDSLVMMKLVYREADKADRRKIWLALTKVGQEYLDKKRKSHEKYFVQLFSSLSEEELSELRENLKKIIETMKKLTI